MKGVFTSWIPRVNQTVSPDLFTDTAPWGMNFRENSYKYGGDLRTWRFIDTEEPDFHGGEFLGGTNFTWTPSPEKYGKSDNA